MRTIRRAILAALVLGWAAGSPAHAQALGVRRMREPAFLRELFPPALIMQHQADIALTDAQRDAISKEMANAEKATVELRWQLEAKTAALGKLLAADTVDEAAALKQADEVLALEDRLKRLRLGSLIRVKNLLTPAQQETLRKLRRR
jgi:Spy/CpxP family protein refolding chaperone